jgi:hypothetical protein
MKNNEYQCNQCKGIFEKGWSDKEAMEEYNTEFAGALTNDPDVVCDTCYKNMTEIYPPAQFVEDSRGEDNK